MLVIRNAQMQAIADALLRRWIVESLRPDHAGVTARWVDAAIVRGRERGYESPEALRDYCRLALVLGPGMETEPAMAWARAILDDPAIVVPRERLLALADAAAAWLTTGAPP